MGVHGVDWPALPLRSAGFPVQSLPLDIRLLVIGTAPLVYLALCFFFVDPVPFLDTSDQLVTSRSSSVSLPQRVFADPFICVHLPFIWSQFMVPPLMFVPD